MTRAGHWLGSHGCGGRSAAASAGTTALSRVLAINPYVWQDGRNCTQNTVSQPYVAGVKSRETESVLYLNRPAATSPVQARAARRAGFQVTGTRTVKTVSIKIHPDTGSHRPSGRDTGRHKAPVSHNHTRGTVAAVFK